MKFFTISQSFKKSSALKALLLVLPLLSLQACALPSDLAGSNGGTDDSETSADPDDSSSSDVNTFEYYDASGNYHIAELQDWTLNDYNPDLFSVDGSYCSYEGDDRYTYSLGVDVSAYQGSIDWEKVKASGYDFAFIRIGFRGYGTEGNMKEDDCFRPNYEGAKAAGLDVGLYFFSQAVNETEAVEEADFVLEILSSEGITPSDLALPIVFDPENVTADDARTDDVSGEQFTRNTLAFYSEIEAAGYTPMVFCNLTWEVRVLDLSLLQDHEVWYADYQSWPQTPYAFSYWQYSESSTVDGIEGVVDTDIRLIPQ